MRTPRRGQPGSSRRREEPRPPAGRRDERPPRGRPSGDRRPRQQEGGPPRGPRRQRQAQQSPAIAIREDLIYGRNAVRESLRAARRKLNRLFIAEGVREDDRIREIIALAQQQDVLVERVPRPMLDDLAHGGNHQGIALDAGEYPYVDLEDIMERDGTVLVMDHLNDPQNFGTLVRAADAAGIAGIVLPTDRSVSVTPAVVNSSAGAVEHLFVAQTPNLARALDKLEAAGRWIVGLDEGEDAQSLFTADVPTPVALVVGAEGSGLTPIVRKRCQMIVEIPMLGRVESLNAATAGSIVLYDLLRRSMEGEQA